MAIPQSKYIARYWEVVDERHIVCRLCPRACRLGEGQRGFCFVRQNLGQQLILTTYRRSSGFCIDPIEKKPLYHFYPGSSVLSFGTVGCNLGCRFCQNWQLSRSKEMARMSEEAAPEVIAACAKKQGCRSVAFTYNDPVIFAEYAIDTAQACHQADVKTVAVTAGYIQGAARQDFFAAMDAANVDLKAFSERFYKDLCQAELAPVLATLEYIRQKTKVWLEITTLLIPGQNDSPEEIRAMTRWIADRLGVEVPLHFSAFHPDYKMTGRPATSKEILFQARDIARANGLRYVYTGNIPDDEGSRTLCHQCGAVLISRQGFRVTKNQLKNNHCPQCGGVCAGCFG